MNKNKIVNFLVGVCTLTSVLCASSVHAQSESVDKMFPNVVIAKDMYHKAVAEMKANPKGKIGNAFNYIKKQADKIISSGEKPTPVLSIVDNPNKVDINSQMKKIHDLCFTYAFTQNKVYMDKAEEFLLAWASINKAVVKRNIHEEVYTQAVNGYSLIRRLLSTESRAAIDKWATDRINVMKGTPDLRINNWGTCLLTQYYIYGYVLDRKDWVDDVKKTYPEWVKTNLYPNGATTDLLGRDAFAYHAYDLLFFARLCHVKAIYEGYDAAKKFYKQDVNWGASIKKSVDYWLPFFLDPEKNYHIEFVETEWRGDKDRGDYCKKYNPMSTLYVMDELYEFDSDLQNLMDKYRKSYTEKVMISALRYLP